MEFRARLFRKPPSEWPTDRKGNELVRRLCIRSLVVVIRRHLQRAGTTKQCYVGVKLLFSRQREGTCTSHHDCSQQRREEVAPSQTLTNKKTNQNAFGPYGLFKNHVRQNSTIADTRSIHGLAELFSPESRLALILVHTYKPTRCSLTHNNKNEINGYPRK